MINKIHTKINNFDFIIDINKIKPIVRVDYSHSMYSNISHNYKLETYLCDNPNAITYTINDDLIVYLINEHSLIVEKSLFSLNPNINKEQLYRLSIKNFYRDAKKKMKIIEYQKGLLKIETEYGNSLILVDEFWKKIHKKLKGDIIFALPHNGIFFVCKAGNRSILNSLIELIRVVHKNHPEFKILSLGLYLKRKGMKRIKLINNYK